MSEADKDAKIVKLTKELQEADEEVEILQAALGFFATRQKK